ncbi:MAG: lipopolysaccharide biosynthesis protein RfbH, partial [Planctomycetaceae bacterium]
MTQQSHGRTADTVRDEIRALVAEYCRLAFPERPFVPRPAGPLAGRGFEGKVVQHLVESSHDVWLTTGRVAA